MSEKENQIVIMPEENKKSYWSLNKFGKYTWKNKWWVVGTTAVVAVAALLVNMFAINKNSETVSSEYGYDFAYELDSKTNELRFIDGTKFNYTDIISVENLESVKASKEDYKNIDIKKMLNKNAIGVSVKQNETPNVTVKETEKHYIITAKTSYFASEEQAKSFIKDVISSEQAKSISAINSYQTENYITDTFSNYEFSRQLEILYSQYNAIMSTYSTLTEKFPVNSVISEGVTLQSQLRSFTEAYKEGSGTIISKLDGDLQNMAYVKYEEGKEAEKANEVRNQCESYKNVLRTNVKEIATYTKNYETLASVVSVNSSDENLKKELLLLNDKIIELRLNNTNILKTLKLNGYKGTDVDIITLDDEMIDAMVEDLTNTKSVLYHLENVTQEWKDGCKAFATTLSNVANQLKTSTVDSTNAHHSLYLNHMNSVNYYTSGYAIVSGGISSALVAVIAAVVAFAASSLIVTAIEINKEKEAEASK